MMMTKEDGGVLEKDEWLQPQETTQHRIFSEKGFHSTKPRKNSFLYQRSVHLSFYHEANPRCIAGWMKKCMRASLLMLRREMKLFWSNLCPCWPSWSVMTKPTTPTAADFTSFLNPPVQTSVRRVINANPQMSHDFDHITNPTYTIRGRPKPALVERTSGRDSQIANLPFISLTASIIIATHAIYIQAPESRRICVLLQNIRYINYKLLFTNFSRRKD
jgi:hypothetical protein